MSDGMKRVLFLLFFISGFCSLLYQVVWLRLAFASFGIITPVLSLLVSIFMTGLAVGSWGAGKWAVAWQRSTRRSAIVLYALAEFVIGISAFAVPWLFLRGERLLLATGEMDSLSYLWLSAAVMVLTVLPWCVAMGATFPLMMSFVRECDRTQSDSFSFLYLANVLGAMGGAIITPLVLVEIFGFHATMMLAACGNFVAAFTSLLVSIRRGELSADIARETSSAATETETSRRDGSRTLSAAVLFTTGFSSLALEVVWTRAFTPVLETQVYSFASLLFTYLLATWIGSQWYRYDLKRTQTKSTPKLVSYLAISAFLQIVLDDPRLVFSPVPLLATIIPFCAILGYLTPKLIDEWSSGQAEAAGRAYAINVVGCIIGPLAASYFLLPEFGVKWSMVLLSVPFLPLAIWAAWQSSAGVRSVALHLVATCAVVATACLTSRSFEDLLADRGAIVRRDHTATIISGGTGMDRQLLVNGYGITGLTPITKIMAHLPMAVHERKPESTLVICFGMGTTYRALLSWGANATAVELVPSVRDAFGYYHDDADAVMQNPRGRVVIDDGRRFLKRTSERFDVITLDPPPPVEAAGSSLLYSEEFYRLVSDRLAEGGILQQWFPGGEAFTLRAMVRSVKNVFPHVVVLQSIEGWGLHILASQQPIKLPTPDEFVARMPPAAIADLMEWSQDPADDKLLKQTVTDILQSKADLEDVQNRLRHVTALTDDRPINEYYFLRRLVARLSATAAPPAQGAKPSQDTASANP